MSGVKKELKYKKIIKKNTWFIFVLSMTLKPGALWSIGLAAVDHLHSSRVKVWTIHWQCAIIYNIESQAYITISTFFWHYLKLNKFLQIDMCDVALRIRVYITHPYLSLECRKGWLREQTKDKLGHYSLTTCLASAVQ